MLALELMSRQFFSSLTFMKSAGLSGGVDSSTAAAILHHQGMKSLSLAIDERERSAAQKAWSMRLISVNSWHSHHIVDSREVFQAIL